MGISICLINQKGGCGKSSSCFHLAGALAASGRSVLLVDVDPQGSISQAFFGSDAVEQMAPWQTMAALFDERCDRIDPSSLIRTTEIDGIFLLPANHHLAAFNQPSPESSGVMQFALRDFLEPLNQFDIMLIDSDRRSSQSSFTLRFTGWLGGGLAGDGFLWGHGYFLGCRHAARCQLPSRISRGRDSGNEVIVTGG